MFFPHSPDVILLAESLPVAHKARVGLVQQHLALRTLQVEHFVGDRKYFLLLGRQRIVENMSIICKRNE